LGVIGFVAALLAIVVQVQAARERAYPTPAMEADVLYITSQTALRRLAGPFRALAADGYWVRTLQYYGGTKRRLAARLPAQAADVPPPLLATDPQEYGNLYQLLDITTTLDPRFDIAYRFGSVFLAEPYPGGAGRPDLAVRLLEKGLRERPDKWEYMEDIGFVHYWYDQDYQKAAAAFDKAGAMPGAPNWLKPLAATTLAQGGDRRSSRAMWLAILQSADVDWLREQAERRLLQLQALDEMDLIQKTLDALAARLGAPATSWETVVRSGVYPGIPVDPTKRTRYQLTTEGRVQLSPASSLNPLPTEPVRIGPAR
jgi:hypothetical protein